MYAPLGTEMRLGDYVRVVRTFLEAFKLAETAHIGNDVLSGSEADADMVPNTPTTLGAEDPRTLDRRIVKLGEDLKVLTLLSRCSRLAVLGSTDLLTKLTPPFLPEQPHCSYIKIR